MATAGRRINYTFVVTNTGNVTLTGVAVTDPSVTVSLPGRRGDARPGRDRPPAPPAYTLTQADIDAGAVNNTADGDGTSARQDQPATDTDSATGPGPAGRDRQRSTRRARSTRRPTAVATPGDLDQLHLRPSTNTGNVTLHGVAVDATRRHRQLPGRLGRARPGRDRPPAPPAIPLTQADIDAGIVTNTATVDGASARTDQPASDTDTADRPGPAGP